MDSHLQHSGGYLQNCPCIPKVRQNHLGQENRQKDAKWIADIFKHDLVSGRFISPADICQLRDLVRYHWKLTSFTTGEKNRHKTDCLSPILSWTMFFPMCLARLPLTSSPFRMCPCSEPRGGRQLRNRCLPPLMERAKPRTGGKATHYPCSHGESQASSICSR